MNLNDLRYLVAIAQERNFRRAADRCFISQPALSLAMQKVENELGIQIFERTNAAVKVTALGEQVVEQAQRVIEEMDKVKAIARQGQDHLAGALKLGVIHTIAPYLLPELVVALNELAPQMPLEIEENLTSNLTSMLKNGHIDAAVVALPFNLPGTSVKLLYDEPFAVVVPAHHPWAIRESVAADELANEKVLLLASGHCFSNQVMEACPELQQRGGEVFHGTSLETIRNMVASGLGITVLPYSALSERYQSPLLRAIPFCKPSPFRQVALVWRNSFSRAKAIDALAESVRSLMASDTAWRAVQP
jgi:LysR family hydrogen peroxide-inducible transcriptional activator